MKKSPSVIKGTLKSFVDIPSWLGWRQLKGNTSSLWNSIVPIFKIQKATRKETFEQAMARFNIGENDLKRRVQSCVQQMIFYFFIAFLGILYMLYLFIKLHFFAGFLMFFVAGLIVVKGLECHFWYFQIKRRKLGCTIKEWLSGNIEE